MKKLVLTALVAGLSTLAFADMPAMSDVYVQGNVSYAKTKFSGGDVKVKGDKPAYRVAVGKDTGDMRYAVDYTFYDKVEDKKKGFEGKIQSVGLSAIYDFETSVPNLTPYAGARVAVNRLEVETTKADGGKHTKKKDKFGAGVSAGVQYHLNSQVAVDAGVQYNDMNKVDDKDVREYGATLGMRYNF